MVGNLGAPLDLGRRFDPDEASHDSRSRRSSRNPLADGLNLPSSSPLEDEERLISIPEKHQLRHFRYKCITHLLILDNRILPLAASPVRIDDVFDDAHYGLKVLESMVHRGYTKEEPTADEDELELTSLMQSIDAAVVSMSPTDYCKQ
jgi:hypothetical protein